MSLSDDEKINYITSYFHQYFDLVLNTNIETTETINLVVPIDYLSDERIVYDDLRAYSHNKTLPEGYNIEDILLKTVKEDGVEVLGEDGEPIPFYQDVSYTDLVPCICTNVVDGDTIDVIIPEEDEEGNTFAVKETIRLVGINTPEMGYNNKPAQEGAIVSKEFMEKACYSKEYLIALKKLKEFSQITEEQIEQMSTIQQEALADEKEYYGNVKNNKKIYLKFDSLKKYASKKKSYDEGKNRRLAVLVVDNKNINEILLKEGLAEIMYIPPSEFNPFEWANPNTSIHVFGVQNSDIQMLSPYFNFDMTNVVFTPKDNPKKIYQYEYYKGVYYIKLQPFSNEIRMHLLPKAYDCSNNVLIFKDDMIKDENVLKTDDYYQFKESDYINSYYLENNKIRDRTNPDISNKEYYVTDWPNTFCDFFYDISDRTQNFTKLQICSGYRYNNSSPYYSIHYTGIRDNTNIAVEDRCTLIDANFDNVNKRVYGGTEISFVYNQNIGLTGEDDGIKTKFTYRKENDRKVYIYLKDEDNNLLTGQSLDIYVNEQKVQTINTHYEEGQISLDIPENTLNETIYTVKFPGYIDTSEEDPIKYNKSEISFIYRSESSSIKLLKEPIKTKLTYRKENDRKVYIYLKDEDNNLLTSQSLDIYENEQKVQTINTHYEEGQISLDIPENTLNETIYTVKFPGYIDTSGEDSIKYNKSEISFIYRSKSSSIELLKEPIKTKFTYRKENDRKVYIYLKDEDNNLLTGQSLDIYVNEQKVQTINTHYEEGQISLDIPANTSNETIYRIKYNGATIGKQNNITQYNYDNQNHLYISKNPLIIRSSFDINIDHVTNLNKTYRKTLKYINDILYSEESYKADNNEIKRGNSISEWEDLSL